MDLYELDELFDDNDEEILEFIMDMRTYTILNRTDHFSKWDEKQFVNRFRFTKNTVRNIIFPPIVNQLNYETHRYYEIKPLDQVLLTLRFYATGNFYITLSDFLGIHKTTAGRIIKKVTRALVLVQQDFITFPENEEEQRNSREGFFSLARFPKVIGALDCTHVKIQSPGGNNAEFFRNRKGYFSLNVQVICNSNYKIVDIVARWPGSCHDSHIFMNSYIKQRFDNGEFGELVLLGDSGYPLMDYLMTPISHPRNRADELYNRSHISTRTIIERTFGIWKRRFPVLSIGMRCKLPLVQRIVIATAVLHNIAVDAKENRNIFNGDKEHNLPNEIDHPNILNYVQQRYINYFQGLL